jgi:hypothetical protein
LKQIIRNNFFVLFVHFEGFYCFEKNEKMSVNERKASRILRDLHFKSSGDNNNNNNNCCFKNCILRVRERLIQKFSSFLKLKIMYI